MSLEQKIGEIIESTRNVLSEDTIGEVDHYYMHGEYEMAFEGLVIELMKSKQNRLDIILNFGVILYVS